MGAVCQKNCFDATVAAYLLNPLKNDYTYEDVAREQLGLMMDDKADEWTKSCYEAYTAYAASEKLMEKLKEEQMDRLFLEIEMPLVFTLFDMEQAGVRIEAEELKNMENNWANRSYSWNPRFTRWQGRILTSILRNSWV